MFILEQINEIHDRLGRAESFAQYVKALNAIGVETYDSYIMDGHSEYFGKSGHTVISPPAHEMLTIADTSDKEQFLTHLNLLCHRPIIRHRSARPHQIRFGARLVMDGRKRQDGCQARRRGQHTRDNVQQQRGGSLVAMQTAMDDQIHWWSRRVSIVLKWLTPFLFWQHQPINRFVYRDVVRGVAGRVLRDVEEPIEATLADVVRQLGRVREAARET